MEQVVLVNDQNEQIGTSTKEAVHRRDTPLHRGFSVFLFNSKKELLLTQRAETKATFPGIWTNTVCGHPAPGETSVEAAYRRLKEELGLTVLDIKEVSLYRYRFTDQNGIVENEICPVLIAKSDAYPAPNPREIAAWKWAPWTSFLEEIKAAPTKFSPWCSEEAILLQQTGFV